MTQSDRALARGSLRPGQLIAERYRVLELVGDGASGLVYRAELLADAADELKLGDDPASVTPGQQVALKVLHRHLIRDRQLSRRFYREARILRRLQGENLVPLLDFGEADDGVLFMALELVEGRALDAIMRAEKGVPPRRAVHLMQQVCRALAIAHDADVVHRDLKPGNVIVEQLAEGGERVRVLDFGMAKMLRGDGSESLNALTEQNMVFGTPEYMAPEQARGDEVDARGDIYAAGVMLYELLTGAVPFQSNTPIGTMTAHLVQEVDPPSLRTPDRGISAALEAVVMHALAKDPAQRYASATALSDALSAAMTDPADLRSLAPPGRDDLATRDTEHALRLPEELGRTLKPNELGVQIPEPLLKPERPSRLWLAIMLIAALIGIALGIIMSLVGAA